MTVDTSTSDLLRSSRSAPSSAPTLVAVPPPCRYLVLEEPTHEMREVVVRPPDELDIATQDTFATAVDWACASGAERVVVDLAAVTFCGAAGLRTLIESAGRLHTTGRVLEVRNPPRTLVRMSTLTGTAELLGLAD